METNRKSRAPQLEETRQQGYVSFPSSMYRAVDSPGSGTVPFVTKVHWHSSAEIIHFIKGTFVVSVNMETRIIRDECFVIVESGMLHSIRSEEMYDETALLFHPAMLSARTIDAAESKLITPFIEGSISFPRLIGPADEAFPNFLRLYMEISDIFLKAENRRQDQYTVSDPSDQLKAKALMMLLIAELSGKGLLAYKTDIQDQKVEALKRVIRYIEEHYTEKMYIKDLAALMNLNVQYFSRFFKHAVGKNPVELINEVRVRHAADLLRTTDRSVLDISLSSGFGNAGHFTDVFKKHTGMKPLEFRNSSRTAANSAQAPDKEE
jgi:AraC-like DNA-binding protein/mannose-6-phosphate isomerase-like protein (cupin superfamily)